VVQIKEVKVDLEKLNEIGIVIFWILGIMFLFVGNKQAAVICWSYPAGYIAGLCIYDLIKDIR